MAACEDNFQGVEGSVDWASVVPASEEKSPKAKKKSPKAKETSPKTCNFGKSCTIHGCPYSHPKGRKEECPDPKCSDLECSKLHTKECYQARRLKQSESSPSQECKHGSECCNFNCPRTHPEGYPGKCQWGAKCYRFGCPKVHPRERVRDCKFGTNCKSFEKGTKYICQRNHPGNHRGKQKKVMAWIWFYFFV